MARKFLLHAHPPRRTLFSPTGFEGTASSHVCFTAEEICTTFAVAEIGPALKVLHICIARTGCHTARIGCTPYWARTVWFRLTVASGKQSHKNRNDDLKVHLRSYRMYVCGTQVRPAWHLYASAAQCATAMSVRTPPRAVHGSCMHATRIRRHAGRLHQHSICYLPINAQHLLLTN